MTEREDLLENVEAVLSYDNEDVWEVLQSVRDYLKAQEPRVIKKSAGHGICPGCGHLIPAWSSPNYCGYCGQAVKWDE